MAAILEVRNLQVAYSSRSGQETRALGGVSFSLEAGEILGVLGESGSGKSSLAAALLGLLPAHGRIEGGSVRFEGNELLGAKEDALRGLRGARIALIPQESGLSLHPALRVREQVSDVLRAHRGGSGGPVREKTETVLRSVFGNEAARIGASYPHELSGGQRQRVLVAQAVACEPAVIVADEPTASLDPATQNEILKLFGRLHGELGAALVLITHSPALLAGFAHRIVVLYAGQVAECGPADEVLARPQHPYTKALLDCLPEWPATHPARTRLNVIAGDPPDMTAPPRGCRFEPRCPERMEGCAAREPSARQLGEGHSASCFKFGG